MKTFLNKTKIESVFLPFLFSIYPATVTYAQNAQILQISSWMRMVLFQLVIGLVVFIVFTIVYHKLDYLAAISAFIFLGFFNVYGIVFQKLTDIDLFPVTHYSLLPLFLVTGISLSMTARKLSSGNSQKIWQILTAIIAFLLIYNLIVLIPKEIEKSRVSNNVVDNTVKSPKDEAAETRDIYYLVFDEFSGFMPIREYWQYKDIDKFKDFLLERGFQVTENSHSSTIDTLQIISSRLNYEEYPLGAKYVNKYYSDVANNKVMAFLKSLGYMTIVFDETRASFAYPAKPSIMADVNYEDDPKSLRSFNSGALFDDYGAMVADNTILLIAGDLYKIHNPELERHRNMVYFTLSELGQVKRPSQPVFVYAHMMIPHMPFMFDENGNNVKPAYHQNWDYYLGNYKFTVNIAKQMVENILSQYDDNNLPIIILQSDHGARNKATTNPGSKILENFDRKYSTSILNAMLLSGCDGIRIGDDFNPVDTFPTVFDCVFGVNVRGD